jgi:beta-1,4-mannosyl-glycoprotein beta-1,4-N-acetylglucosaminyltransferase
MKPTVFDCFCFFNEHDLLKLRLETLWDVVDVFVLVESSLTFSGKTKPLHYDASQFGPYSSKIRHIVVDDFPFDICDPWRNERFQRNAIERGLVDATPKDWIIVGDVDEIPNPEKIKEFNPAKFRRGDFSQKNFAYYLNNCNVDKNGDPVLWRGSKITTYQCYKDFFECAERVRSFKSSGILRAFKREWFHKFQVQVISEGGWHFSWMSGVDGIIRKLESFSHQEFNTPEFKDPKNIVDRIRAGEDILKMGASFTLLPLDEGFPAPLRLGLSSYRHLLLSSIESEASMLTVEAPLQ